MLKKVILAIWLLNLTNLALVADSERASSNENFRRVFYLPGTDGTEERIKWAVEFSKEQYTFYKSYGDKYLGPSFNLLLSKDPTYFAKIVTPEIFMPFAKKLREFYPEDKDFINAVLALVQQIPYDSTKLRDNNKEIREFYPMETLYRNKGDCSSNSVLAASILKAGGIDVALLWCKVPIWVAISDEDSIQLHHVFIGVNLPDYPKTKAHYCTYKGKHYYFGECTEQTDLWEIGQEPVIKMFNISKVNVIPLDNLKKQKKISQK